MLVTNILSGTRTNRHTYKSLQYDIVQYCTVPKTNTFNKAVNIKTVSINYAYQVRLTYLIILESDINLRIEIII